MFVLIHSPLVGPSTWRLVAEELERRGYRAVVPSLDAAAGPPYWPRYVELVAQAVHDVSSDRRLVLVAHSGAGLLLPATRAALRERPVHRNVRYIYIAVDAALPRGVTSLVDAIPASAGVTLNDLRALATGGRLPPWGTGWPDDVWAQLIPDQTLRARFRGELRPAPLALYEERLPAAPTWPDAPCAYLRLSAPYADAEDEARRLGCVTRELAGGHLHMLVEPARVADALIELATMAPEVEAK